MNNILHQFFAELAKEVKLLARLCNTSCHFMSPESETHHRPVYDLRPIRRVTLLQHLFWQWWVFIWHSTGYHNKSFFHFLDQDTL